MYDERKMARERRVRSHLMRVAILDLLAKGRRELTASQIRAELPGDRAVGSVNYHLRILSDSHLVVAEGGCFKLSRSVL